MSKKSKPHAGSVAYYPKKRADSIIPKFNSLPVPKSENVQILNYYGYKVGMLHVMAMNKHKGSPYNNQKVALPSTVIEFPPISILGVRFYTKKRNANKALKEFILPSKGSKFLSKRITGINRMKEKGDLLKSINDYFEENKEKITDLVLISQTHPEKTTIGKKSPEVVELKLSGKLEDKFTYFKEHLGKDLDIEDAFKESLFVDVKGITIGKGFSGTIKRHGIKRLSHKSEKGVRGVGSIGPWHPPLIMSTVPRPGQLGFYNRIELNKRILKFLPSTEINPKSGWEGYGVVKNKAGIFSGSIPGHVKRLVAIRYASRTNKISKLDISEITNIVF